MTLETIDFVIGCIGWLLLVWGSLLWLGIALMRQDPEDVKKFLHERFPDLPSDTALITLMQTHHRKRAELMMLLVVIFGYQELATVLFSLF